MIIFGTTVMLMLAGIGAFIGAVLDHADSCRHQRARGRELLRVNARAARAQFELDQAAFLARQAMMIAARTDDDNSTP